jgi:hypothetical protein
MSATAIVILALGVLLGAISLEYYLKRGKARPLARRFNDPGLDAPKAKPALGTEAIDHTAFNRMMRQNNALAMANGSRGEDLSLMMEAHLHPTLPPRIDRTDVGHAKAEAMRAKQKSRGVQP